MEINILMVDDEPFQLRLTKKLITDLDPSCGVTAVTSATKALELLQEQSFDVLITDVKMPEINGLELVEKIRNGSRNKSLIIVILSGYEDFTYAQTAIKYHAFSYLLKPISKKDLSNLLESVREELRSRITPPLFTIENAAQQQLEYSFYKLIQQISLTADEFSSLEKKLGKDTPLYVFAERCKEDSTSKTASLLAQVFPFCISFSITATLFLHIFSTEPDDDPAAIFDTIQNMVETLEDEVQTGLSCPHELTHLYCAYLEARSAIASLFYDPTKRTVQYTISKRNPAAESKLLDGLKDAIATNNKKAIGTKFTLLMNCYAAAFLDQQDFLKTILNTIYQMLVNYSFLFVSEGLRNDYHYHYACLFEQAQTAEELLQGLFEFSASLSKMLNQSSYGNLQENCKMYIQKNLALGITLSKMAEDFNYNVSYFSELFTKLFGVSFSEYLLSVRMTEAVSLLENTDEKIYEIAKLTGFNTDAYFVKSFKDYYGTPPKKYRHRLAENNKL